MLNLLRQFAYDTSQLGQGIPHIAATQGTLNLALNAVYGLAGALAVIFLIIGGLRYIGSQGDNSAITKAKYTITYAVIGLVVVLLAFAITNFVLGHIHATTWPELRDSVINTLFYIAGTLAIIMIIVGGIRYTTSGGDIGDGKGNNKMKVAKSTISSAIIGLVIVLLAYAIVNFVIRSV